MVFLGTSLTAGLGVDPSERLSRRCCSAKIDSAGLPFTAVNAGVSGETSAGALRRIDWLLQRARRGAGDRDRRQRRAPRARCGHDERQHPGDHRPRAASSTRRRGSCSSGCGRRPTMGSDYVRRIQGRLSGLAKQNELPLVPFLLEGVAGRPSLNQARHDPPDGGGPADHGGDGMACGRAGAAGGRVKGSVVPRLAARRGRQPPRRSPRPCCSSAVTSGGRSARPSHPCRSPRLPGRRRWC